MSEPEAVHPSVLAQLRGGAPTAWLSGWEYAGAMSPIPGEPLEPKPPELTTSDGRKFKLKVPGLAPQPQPGVPEERGSAGPPRNDPRPPVDPDRAGS